MNIPEITPAEFVARRERGEALTLLDVREDWELDVASVPDVVHIPMGEVAERLGLGDAYVIFGHTHRAGPLPSDSESEWHGRAGALARKVRNERILGPTCLRIPFIRSVTVVPGFPLPTGRSAATRPASSSRRRGCWWRRFRRRGT